MPPEDAQWQTVQTLISLLLKKQSHWVYAVSSGLRTVDLGYSLYFDLSFVKS